MRIAALRVAAVCAVLLAAAAAGFGATPPRANAAVPPAPAAQSDYVYIYLFWGEGCPHCAKAKPFLEGLAQADPRVVLRSYEIYYDAENQRLFEAITAAAGFEAQYVPTILIGVRHWEGFGDQTAREIETALAECLRTGCPDPGAGIVAPLPSAIPATPPPAAGVAAATAAPASVFGPQPPETSTPPPPIMNVPLLGDVDLSAQSLPAATVLIALIDGFNPCSLWVLSMLLALTLHTGSRRKVMWIGLIFLTVTAAVYALFIAGLFTVLSVLSFTGWVQVLISLVALAFGLINLKDYFWFREGLSLTIPDEEKPGIARRIRALMDPNLSFWGLAGGTVVLAAGVSLVEFTCTAGFPVLWTNLLASQHTGAAAFAVLLLLYMVIYQLDELAIFGAAVVSLRASRLEEKHGRILKLVGGMLMLALAAVMLIRPSLMNDLGASLLIFGLALAAAGTVLFLHRVVLPAAGIRIGSGWTDPPGE